MRKRILLLYSPNNSGHQKAAWAIQEAIKKFNSDTQTLAVDFFGYNNPLSEKVMIEIYLILLKTVPQIWGYLYDNSKLINKTRWLRDFIYRMSTTRLKVLLENFQPDAVVCTQAFPCGVMADYKEASGDNTFLVGVLTDYLAHSYWVCSTVDRYVVPSLRAKNYLSRFGIAEKKIFGYGIPIHPKFRVKFERKEILKKLDLRADLPIILVMGGGRGTGPIERVVRELIRIKQHFQIIAVTGCNDKLKNKLEKEKSYFKKPIRIIGYTDDINEIMEVSTLIITKPGGLSAAEALAKNLPIIILRPIPGQEINNTQFLLDEGVALKADNEKEAAELALRLLMTPSRLKNMRRKCRENSNPQAAFKIAKLILET